MEAEKDDVDEVMDEAEKKFNNISLELDDEIPLEEFAYRENFSAGAKLQGELTFVPVMRPNPQSWIYIPSNQEMRATVAVLELKQRKETYLVRPQVAASLDGECSNRLLVPYQDRDGGLFLWAVRLTDSRGGLDSWTTSALRVVHEYCDKWIKVKAKMNASCYEVILAPIEIPPPEWPPEGLRFLVNRAFKNRVINTINDPTIKRLKGLL